MWPDYLPVLCRRFAAVVVVVMHIGAKLKTINFLFFVKQSRYKTGLN